jgi:DNA repair exonuclease SbcCD ATPase subunit
MIYIEKVILENFQSHKYSVLEFDDQLNVILGPSDSGKTAILRGIRWALYNEPSGDYFIREGEQECSVTIVFNDGTKIKRYRSKSKNAYFLYDSDNNETKFEGFGTSVPYEITEKIGIKKILLDSDLSKAINLSDQLEGAFLLSEKTSTRASSIGRLVGVNIIDDALREALRDSRNLSNAKKNIEDSINKLEDELLEYDYLEELNNNLNHIDDIRKQIKEKSISIDRYKALLTKLTSISQEKSKVNYYIESLSGINLLDKVLNDISLSLSKYGNLNKLKDVFDRLLVNKSSTKLILESLKDIESIENHMVKMTSLYDLRINLINYNLKSQSLSSEIKDIKSICSKLASMDILQNHVSKIDNNIKELSKLTILEKQISSLNKSLAIGTQYVDRLQGVDNATMTYNKLQEAINLLFTLNRLYTSYISNRDEIMQTKVLQDKYKNQVEKQALQYKETLLKQEVCPLCFSTIDNEKINHIIDHYN